MTNHKNILILIFILVIYLTGFTLASFYNSDFGNLQVHKVTIFGQEKICGLSYRPKDSSELNAFPAVVLSHGISGSKQMMSAIALELARNGFVTLSIDLIGHGGSDGAFGAFGAEPADKTLGMKDAVQYLRQQPFVNSSQIGLVGHSLGAGAVRATTAVCSGIKASVFIGGGFGELVNDPEYGLLNSTFPKNLLVIIGEHDVLFDIEQTKQELIPVFGNPSEISPNTIYGDFSDETARSLIIPKTTHLLEPVDQTATSEVITWMKKSLNPSPIIEAPNLTFLNREIAIGVSLAAFTVLLLPFSSLVLDHYPSLHKGDKKTSIALKDWQILAFWGTMGLVLFLPMFFVGSLIPYPPLIFGNSFAWWLMTTAITGLLTIRFILPKYTKVKINLKSALIRSFTLTNIMMAIGIFTLLYSIAHITETILLTDLRIVILPLFKALTTSKRILAFLTFIPFYLLYFFVEGLYIHQFRKPTTNANSQIKDLIKTIIIRTAPYLTLLIIHYLPLLLFNIRVFPPFIGFIMEFIVGIIPLFLMSTIYSWWFYNKTDNLAVGTTLNAILFAWS